MRERNLIRTIPSYLLNRVILVDNLLASRFSFLFSFYFQYYEYNIVYITSPTMSSFDITATRKCFPALDKKQVYLDNAGGSQTLGTVIERYFL